MWAHKHNMACTVVKDFFSQFINDFFTILEFLVINFIQVDESLADAPLVFLLCVYLTSMTATDLFGDTGLAAQARHQKANLLVADVNYLCPLMVSWLSTSEHHSFSLNSWHHLNQSDLREQVTAASHLLRRCISCWSRGGECSPTGRTRCECILGQQGALTPN